MYTPEWNKALNDGTLIAWPQRGLGARACSSGNAADTKGKWKIAPLPQWNAGDARDRQLGRLVHRGDRAVQARRRPRRSSRSG